MRNLLFGAGEYYHIYARGVDKRNVFIDDHDRSHFLATMQKANIHGDHRRVGIVAYVLMSNHVHVLLRHEGGGGVPKFMQRLNNAYVKYFNKRHDRDGRLFSSTYKAKHISSDRYFFHLSRYIHQNPLSLGGITIKTLDQYRWSSYRHYLGLEQKPFIHAEVIMDAFREVGSYRAFVNTLSPHNEIASCLFDEN